MDSFIGAPATKTERSRRTYFKFSKDVNTLVLRILPPLGPLAKSGTWSIYHNVEYGYKNSEGKMRPFLSPRVVDRKTKMVVQESEAHLRREKLKAQFEQAKKLGNKELADKIENLIDQYNLSSRHYMNVIDLNGNIGVLELQHKAKISLDALRNAELAKGTDIVSADNGRYIVFTRTPNNRDTVFSVSIYKRKVKAVVGGVERELEDDMPHSIDQALVERLKKDAADLSTLYPSVTPEQEFRIVHEGAKAVDEILDSRRRTNPASTAQQTAATPAVQQPVTAQVPNNIVDDTDLYDSEVLDLVGDDGKDGGGGTRVQTASATSAQLAATTTQNSLTSMSDDELLKMISEGKF